MSLILKDFDGKDNRGPTDCIINASHKYSRVILAKIWTGLNLLQQNVLQVFLADLYVLWNI